MKKSQKNVLPFPTPPEEPARSPIIVQIGNERFDIHYQIEDLPPAAHLVLWKRATEKVPAKIPK